MRPVQQCASGEMAPFVGIEGAHLRSQTERLTLEERLRLQLAPGPA
jgi:hypothetical protein